MRPTHAEINLSHFLHNLSVVRRQIGPRPRIMAIVKANAYGHGLPLIAKASIDSEEVDTFGVATEEEGCLLRRMTSKPILVLTGVLWEEIDVFLANDLGFTLTDLPTLHHIAARARATGRKARVHLKVDTGMRRLGVEPGDAIHCMQAIEQEHEWVEFAGISTHFATSDEIGSSFFREQLARFTTVLTEATLAGISLPTVHAANSGAILQAPREAAFDMVRPGIMLYGYAPSFALQSQFGSELRPPLALTSSVVFAKRIHAGEGVSYNLRWKAPRESTILTVPIGYGDGYPRLLTNRTSAVIRGKAYPIVGTICMDQLLIDAGDDAVDVGEKVYLIESDAEGISAWKLAKEIGTIPYEILTNIAARVPRVAI